MWSSDLFSIPVSFPGLLLDMDSEGEVTSILGVDGSSSSSFMNGLTERSVFDDDLSVRKANTLTEHFEVPWSKIKGIQVLLNLNTVR